ncbi:MAG: helix-turn-helix domain-containing protein, partial [bacterium]
MNIIPSHNLFVNSLPFTSGDDFATLQGVMSMGVEWLKRLLSEHHMTQGELAEKLGVSKAIVSSWLSGVRRIPVKRLKEIARLFSLS